MNITIIKGNITSDIDRHDFEGGGVKASFGLAWNHVYFKEDGTKVERASFFNVEYFGKAAEHVLKWFAKGDPILVTGRLHQDRWKDETRDENRTAVKIMGQGLAEFCGANRNQSESQTQSEPEKSDEPEPEREPAQSTMAMNGGETMKQMEH